MKHHVPDQWVVPASLLRPSQSAPWEQPHWGKLIEQIDRIEGLAHEACYRAAMQCKRLEKRMSELDILMEQLADRMGHFLADYENQVALDQEEARRDWAEYMSDNRLRARDVL